MSGYGVKGWIIKGSRLESSLPSSTLLLSRFSLGLNLCKENLARIL